MMMEKFRYVFPIVLGNCIMLFVRWKWFWTINERIFQVSYEKEIVQWGNILLRLVTMFFIAVCVKWNIRKEVFHDHGKHALKRKIIWLLFLNFIQDVGSEVLWKLHGYRDGLKGIYDNSYWILDSISNVNILFIIYILAAALAEELFFRYVTCNCLRKLHINCGVIVILQVKFI